MPIAEPMPYFTLFIGPSHERCKQQRSMLDFLRSLGHPIVHEESPQAAHECLNNEMNAGRLPLCVVFGKSLNKPLKIAHGLRQDAPLAQFIFLAADGDQAFQYALGSPLSRLGNYYNIIDDNIEAQLPALYRAYQSTLQRYQFRTTLRGIGRQLSRRERSKLPALHCYTNSVHFLSNIFENASDAIIAMTNEGIVVKWNRAAQALFGCNHERALGHPVTALLRDDLAHHILSISATMIAAGNQHDKSVLELPRDTGCCWALELSFSAICAQAENICGISLVVRDISEITAAQNELKQLNDELNELSFHDALTGIDNRRQFEQTIEREWKHAKRASLPISLILIDIDFFKLYNDYYGHPQGDVCLKAIAQALSKTPKRETDLTARFGGEEFAILLPGTEIGHALQIANACRNNVMQLKLPHDKSPISEHVTISAGINSLVPGKEVSLESFIQGADKMLYQAKRNGRNRVEFNA